MCQIDIYQLSENFGGTPKNFIFRNVLSSSFYHIPGRICKWWLQLNQRRNILTKNRKTVVFC